LGDILALTVELSQGALGFLAVSATAIAVVSLLLCLVLGRRVATLRRAAGRRSLRGGHVPTQADGSGTLTNEVAVLGSDVAMLTEAVGRAVQNVGLVRFDAFEDMGGALSFAAALLDAEGNGIVLSSINGRSETRIYAKPIERGTSRINLSGEEEEAIRRALGLTVRR
jgi:hypothetical protein